MGLRRSRLVSIIHSVTLLLLMAAIALPAPPLYNWDLVAYVAIAHQFDGLTIDDAHRKSFDELHATLSDERYDLFVNGSSFRQEVARRPEALRQQLPFHLVKPAYPALIWVGTRLGLPAIQGSILISQLAYFVVGIVLLCWVWTIVRGAPAVLIVWLLMSVSAVVWLARASTPDALSTAFVLVAFYLYFVRRTNASALAILLVSLIIRPDNLLWLAIIITSLLAERSIGWRGALAWLVAGASIYLTAAQLSDYYGWTTLFYVNFIDRLPYPNDVDISLTLRDLLSTYLRQAHPANVPPLLYLMVGIGAGTVSLRFMIHGARDRWFRLVTMCLAFVVLHWILLPLGDERFFITAYLLVLVALLQSGIDWWKSTSADRSEARAA